MRCNRFAAGTGVVVGVDAGGNFVTESIENIEIGDVVLATDEFNPEAPPEYKLVTGVSSRTVEGLKEVTYNVDGNVETIQTTENHEFFVVGIGWLLASELTSAHVLRLADGSEVAVSSVTDLVGSATVYNLTVTDGATYFVDDGSGVVDAIVVHNARLQSLAKLFPGSTAIRYGEGLSALALQRRLAGNMRRSANIAVVEFVHNGRRMKKVFLSKRFGKTSIHSEDVAAAWLQKKGVLSKDVKRIYSEFHPCTRCHSNIKNLYPNVKVEFSWPYKGAKDSITQIGRDLKKIELKSFGL